MGLPDLPLGSLECACRPNGRGGYWPPSTDAGSEGGEPVLRIFYSWASDETLSRNRVIIRNALDAALAELCSPQGHDVPEGQRQVVECDGSQAGDIVEF